MIFITVFFIFIFYSGQTARSKPILRKLTATSVQSTFLHTYYLEGNIVDNENGKNSNFYISLCLNTF